MDYEPFGFAESESDWDGPNGTDRFRPEDRSPVDSVDTDALERWVGRNQGLWKLGIHLAEVASQYRREYEYVPFNQLGWFSPN